LRAWADPEKHRDFDLLAHMRQRTVSGSTQIVHNFVTRGFRRHTFGMTAHSLVVLRPRFRASTSGFRATLRDVMAEFVTFERAHARVAWGATIAGFVIGLGLRALG
jgi:hypothetical protein